MTLSCIADYTLEMVPASYSLTEAQILLDNTTTCLDFKSISSKVLYFSESFRLLQRTKIVAKNLTINLKTSSESVSMCSEGKIAVFEVFNSTNSCHRVKHCFLAEISTQKSQCTFTCNCLYDNCQFYVVLRNLDQDTKLCEIFI